MINVVGSGLAGLLAGNMLGPNLNMIYEKQDRLPNNHSAVLRFRSSIVGDTVGIPFSEVPVIRATETLGNPIADMMSYSRKCTGTCTFRSLPTGDEVVKRFIAPSDLIAQMAARIPEEKFSFGVDCLDQMQGTKDTPPIISTIPMPILMKALGWDQEMPTFRYSDGHNVKFNLRSSNAFCSLYIPDLGEGISRISVTGDEVVAEIPAPEIGFETKGMIARLAVSYLGLPSDDIIWDTVKVSQQAYSKILPIDEGIRKRFILWASETHKVYSLGRFATWRPGLLLDDVVNDVRVIQRLIASDGREAYNQKKG